MTNWPTCIDHPDYAPVKKHRPECSQCGRVYLAYALAATYAVLEAEVIVEAVRKDAALRHLNEDELKSLELRVVEMHAQDEPMRGQGTTRCASGRIHGSHSSVGPDLDWCPGYKGEGSFDDG